MAMEVPGADNQSSAEQVPQISGSESETSLPRHVDLNLNLPTSIPTPTYNPYMLMQQIGPHNGYPPYQIADAQPLHYDQQSYMPSSLHGRNLYATSQEVHYGYQRYHTPVQEQMQGYSELQQPNYMQQAEGYVHGAQTTFETRPQVPIHRILPRRLPHLRQRIRRRNRTNRGHISNIHSVTEDIAHSNREYSTATSLTGSVTSGPIPQTAVDLEGSQERLSRLTSAVTALEESSGIGENFECNICFQKANEAVVTCCGHLFCWPCLYRWLHVHSYHKECPVCKGAIAEYSITPIYGREDAIASARMQCGLGSERIPPRPAARRIESARQQREREERERERELREAEARETTNQEQIQGTEIDQVAAVIVEEGDLRATGSEALTPEATPQREDIPLGSVDTAARLQDMERGVNQFGGGAGEPTEYSHSGYLQRRLAFRREQVRQALANTGDNAGINQNPGSRSGEGQQMLAATALLSQEWEHIINGSHFMVDPTQAAASLASIHARLAEMEGHAGPNSDAVQQRRQMIASAVSQLSQQPQEDSDNRLTVHPSQVSDWIITMRARLDNIEQIMHNLEGPIGGNRMPQLINSPDLGGVNPVQLTDTEVLNPNEFLSNLNATSAPQELVSDSERSPDPDPGLNAANESQSNPERTLSETQVVRRSRRRREHGEEASHTAGHEEGTEASHESQVLVTRKRRRRLD